MSTTTRVSRYLPAAERRTVIVAAVLQLAAKQNPSDITTAAIATHIGLTQGALFRHFPSKEAVLVEVMKWVAQQLLQRLDKEMSAAATPLEALEAAFLAHVKFVRLHPGVPRLLFSELQRPDNSPLKRMVSELLLQYGQRIEAQLRAGIAEGTIDLALEPRVGAAMLLGMVQGLIIQSLVSKGRHLVNEEAGKIFAIYRKGIVRRS